VNIIKPLHKFKIFKYDAAPFFFYIEVFPPDLTYFRIDYLKTLLGTIKDNPIMPLPMRVDRVFNGENSILIRPREITSISISDDTIATINPTSFLEYGFKKLLFFTEVRAYEKFFQSINLDKVNKWWNSTQFLYAKLLWLEEDFSDFLKAYLQTLLKAKINNEDLVSAAIDYCNRIKDVCEKRLKENVILIETIRKEEKVQLFVQKTAQYRKKMKKIEQVQYHPELVDIDVFDLSDIGFQNIKNRLQEVKPKEIKYIPLLFYDDLLECMLQNLKKLDEGEDNILDPSFLLENNIVNLSESTDFDYQEYSWINPFEILDFTSNIDSIKNVKVEHYKSVKKDRIITK
jgi:hypothetical protein